MMREKMIRRRIIEDEEHLDQFEGYDENEIYGGRSNTNPSRSSISQSQSRSDLSKSRKSSTNVNLNENQIPVPRLNIRGNVRN
jgi:hypothetical protein